MYPDNPGYIARAFAVEIPRRYGFSVRIGYIFIFSRHFSTSVRMCRRGGLAAPLVVCLTVILIKLTVYTFVIPVVYVKSHIVIIS
jgi:hypothetical protein